MAPLVNYLTSSDLEVHRTTAAALHQLSKVHCAFKVHKKLTRLTGEVDYDVSMTTNCLGPLELCDNAPVGCGHTSAEAHRVRRRGCSGLSQSHDPDILMSAFCQEAAADCLQNIRKLALACEKFRYQHLKS